MGKWLSLLFLLVISGTVSVLPESAVCGEIRAGVNGRTAPEMQSKEITVIGTVVFVKLEGGFWGIRGDDGQRYDPSNLGKEFRKEGLRIKLQARLRNDVVSFRMWGKVIEVLSVMRLDDKGTPLPAQ